MDPIRYYPHELPPGCPITGEDVQRLAEIATEVGRVSEEAYSVAKEAVIYRLAPRLLPKATLEVTEGIQLAPRLDSQLKQDGSVVTPYDLVADNLAKRLIRDAWPTWRVVSEESEDEGESSEYVVVADGIDGSQGLKDLTQAQACMIAITYKGAVVAGALYDATMHMLIIGITGGNTYCEGTLVSFAEEPTEIGGNSIYLEATALTTQKTGLYLESLFYREKGKISRGYGIGSAVAKLIYGLSICVASRSMSPWDFLPLIPIVRGAGGHVLDLAGEEFVESVSIGGICFTSRGVRKEVREILQS